MRRKAGVGLGLSLLFTVALHAPADATGNSAQIGITYFEPIRSFEPRRQNPAAPKASGMHLSFDAFGRHFELQLEPNDRIAPPARRKSGTESLQLLRGTLNGKPGSWVRLAGSDQQWRGMIWDGAQTYVIDSAATVRDSLLPPLAAGDSQTIIFRLSDTLPGTVGAICGTPAPAPGKPASGQDVYDGLIRELHKQVGPGSAMQALGASLRLEMSILGDAAFRMQHASDDQARTELVTRMNIIDGIYSSQLGVAIQSPIIRVDAAATQALSATTVPSDLLDELGKFREQSVELHSQGLTHLFTGRDLDSTTVGIAYRDSLCARRYGVGLTEARNRGAGFDALIAAHEIGHNFGAVHDGEAPAAGDPDCSSTPANQFLMSPSVNTTHTTFSQCSVNLMQPKIQAASCIGVLSPADLVVAADLGTLHRGVSRAFDLVLPVTNTGGRTATGTRAELLVPPSVLVDDVFITGGSCTSGGGAINCQLGEIAGGASAEIHLTLRSNTLGTNSFSLRTFADSDAQPANNDGDGTLIIDPEVDLGVDVQAPQSGTVGINFATSFSVANLTTIDAGAVTLDIELPPAIIGWAASLGGVGCTTIKSTLIRCTVASIAANGTRTGTIMLHPRTGGTAVIRVRATGTFVDPVTANNVAERTVSVAGDGAQGAAGSGTKRSGGGSADALLALVLTLIAGARMHRKLA